MAEYLVDGNDLQDIANAIREKSGETATMRFKDFSTKIRNMTTTGPDGGGLTIDTQGTFKLRPGESRDVFLYDDEVNGRRFAVRLDPTNCAGVLQYQKATLTMYSCFKVEFGRLDDYYYVYPEYSTLANTWFILPRCSSEGSTGFSVSLGDDGGEFPSAELLVEWGYLETSEIDLTLQTKTVTKNGTYIPDPGYDGFREFTVNVESSGGGLKVISLQTGILEIGQSIAVDGQYGRIIAVKFKNCNDTMAVHQYGISIVRNDNTSVTYNDDDIYALEMAGAWLYPCYYLGMSTGDVRLEWGDSLAANDFAGARIEYEIGYVQ